VRQNRTKDNEPVGGDQLGPGSSWSMGSTTGPARPNASSVGRTVTSQHRDTNNSYPPLVEPKDNSSETYPSKIEHSEAIQDDKNPASRRRGSSGSRLPFFQRLAEDTEEIVDDQNLSGSMKEDSQYLVDSH